MSARTGSAVPETADGLAVEPQVAGDRADRPLLLQQPVDVRVAVAGALDDRSAGLLEDRQVDHGRLGPHLLLGVLAQAGAVLVAGLLDRRGQVLQQVPAVGNLDRVRRGLLDRPAVGAGTVAADDLGTGVLAKPGGEGFRGPAGQDVNDTAGLDVDQQGAVGAASAEGELVDAQHPRRPFRHFGGFEQSEEPGEAGRDAELAAQPLARAAAELGGDGPQPLLQARAGAQVTLAQSPDLLDERPPPAPEAVAEIPAHPQPYQQLPPGQRAFGHRPPVRGVDSPPPDPAVRAADARTARGDLDQHQVQPRRHPLQFNIDSGEQHIFDRIESHLKGIPQRNDPAFTPRISSFTELRSEPNSKSPINSPPSERQEFLTSEVFSMKAMSGSR